MAYANRVFFGWPVYSDVGIYTPSLYPETGTGSWLGALPLTNLLDRKLSLVARSTDASVASSRFGIDLGVERLVRAIAIPKHNISKGGQIRVRASLSAGSAWTLRTSGFGADNIRAAAFGKGLFLTGGNAGKLCTSPDGTTWTARTSGFGADTVRGIAYSPTLGLFVIVGNAGKLATSPDGITWTLRTSSFGATDIYGVVWGNGLFVAVALAGKVATSPDGITWTQRTSSFGATDIVGVTYSPALNRYVAVGGATKLATSHDGITWTQQTSGFTGIVWSVIYAAGPALFVAVGESGELRTSPDGVTWTGRTSQFGASTIYDVTYGNGFYVTVWAAGKLATSADGVTWSLQTSQFGATDIHAVTAGYGADVAAGDAATVSSSTATLYDSGQVDVWPAIYPAGSLPSDDPRAAGGAITAEDAQGYPVGFLHIPATAQTARWWAVFVTDPNNPAGYVELARLLITGGWQPTINAAVGLKHGWATATTRQETDGAAAVYNEKRRRRIVSGVITGLPEDEALVSPFEIQRRLGTHSQLMFCYDPNDTYHLHRRAFLGVMRELAPLEVLGTARAGFPFSVIEEL